MKIKEKKIDIFCDETTDRMGRCVFAVLFRILCDSAPELVVAGVHFLESANATNCIRAILDSMREYGVDYGSVNCIVTDSARYMTKCVEGLKLVLGDHLMHIQCWAHKLSLLGNICPQELPELNAAVTKAKSLFLNTRKRKHLYSTFLKEKKGSNCPMFPMPVVTRWNSWFSSVFYLADYLANIVEFCKSEELKDIANCGVNYFVSLSSEEVSAVCSQAIFIREHFQCLVELVTKLEGSKYPTAHLLYEELGKLQMQFKTIEQGIIFSATTDSLASLSSKQTAAVKASFKQVASKMLVKLNLLMLQDPGRDIFKKLAVLHRKSILLKEIDPSLLTDLSKLPFLKELEQDKLISGYTELKDCVVKRGSSCEFDIRTVLKAVSISKPDFAEKSMQLIWLPCANVDSERFLSCYNSVLTDMRTNLSENNLCIMSAFAFES